MIIVREKIITIFSAAMENVWKVNRYVKSLADGRSEDGRDGQGEKRRD